LASFLRLRFPSLVLFSARIVTQETLFSLTATVSFPSMELVTVSAHEFIFPFFLFTIFFFCKKFRSLSPPPFFGSDPVNSVLLRHLALGRDPCCTVFSCSVARDSPTHGDLFFRGSFFLARLAFSLDGSSLLVDLHWP